MLKATARLNTSSRGINYHHRSIGRIRDLPPSARHHSTCIGNSVQNQFVEHSRIRQRGETIRYQNLATVSVSTALFRSMRPSSNPISRTFTSSKRAVFRDDEERRCHVNGLGENWTGAFGTGKLDQVIVGHNDEEDEYVETPISVFSSVLYHKEDGFSVSVGLGHSAIIDQNNVLRIAGQPHDWQKLFRYRRMPDFLQRLANNFESIPTNPFGESLSWLMKKYNENQFQNREALDRQGLMKIQEDQDYLPGERQLEDLTMHDWKTAEEFSFLNEFKEIPTPEPVQKVVCSAALTGVLGESGRLYIMGQNFFGQCGTGRMTDSNIWLPRYPVVRAIPDDIADDFHLLESHLDEDGNIISIGSNEEEFSNKSAEERGETIIPDDLQESGDDGYFLPRERIDETHEDYNPDDPFDVLFVRDFDLGLQNGVAVDDVGRMYCWGKGNRGQLGQKKIWGDSCAALRVHDYFELDGDFDDDKALMRPRYGTLGPIKQVAAGMLHCAALSYSNQLYIWGKNVLPPLPQDRARKKKASDCKVPYQLPRHKFPNCKCLQISCGSHHTSMLFEDGSVYAVGISTDTNIPLLVDPVELIPPGVLELPVRHFSAHMDRTTAIGRDGKQVLQVQLWEDPEMRSHSIFTPAWVDRMLEEQPDTKIDQVHRCWAHSLIVSSTPNIEEQEVATPAAAAPEKEE
uniref:Uncharacterized protein n=1 Tax=Entomoneis paludosa TaxID=265537 RepID=A0A7S2VEI9_9STRA